MIDSVNLISSEVLPIYFVPNLQSGNQDARQIDSSIPDIVLGDGHIAFPLPSSSRSPFENLSRNLRRSLKFTASSISLSELFANADQLLVESHENNQEDGAKIFVVLCYASVEHTDLSAATPSEQRVPDELAPFSSIQFSDYEKLLKFALGGLSESDSWHDTTDTASWYGEFQPMLMHTDADGTEITEPLPDEPPPMSRKRQIRRTG